MGNGEALLSMDDISVTLSWLAHAAAMYSLYYTHCQGQVKVRVKGK
jgi:hypothetical protein